jgi:PAS domain S-box-containing protein
VRARLGLVALAALAILFAGIRWLWIPANIATLGDDLRALGLGPEAGQAVIAEIADEQETLVLAFAGVAAIVIAAAWFGLERYIRGPAAELARRARRAAQGDPSPAPFPAIVPATNGRFSELARAVGELAGKLASTEDATRQEAAMRERAEAALRASEERYAMAIRCANEGLWEWDLKTGLAYYARNWKALLGYADDEIGQRQAEWTDRIHPEDRDAVLTLLNAHIAGETDSFQSDHRLLHKDGAHRWFLARGQLVRSASGAPYKLVALNTDITARKRAEQILLGIANGLSQPRGEEFFNRLVRNFAEVLGAKVAFICQCANVPTTRVRMLSCWNDGRFAENVEFNLEGTPCNTVITKGELTFIPCGVEKLFPREAGYESYLGLPIFDRNGSVIGHLACFDTKPMQDDLPKLPIFTIFAVRAGIEIEQRMLDLGATKH